MDKYSLDDSVLLSKLCHLYQSCIRIVIIILEYSFHPARSSFLYIICNAVRKEGLDMTSSDGYIDHTHLHIFGKGLHKSPSEIIGRSQSCAWSAQRRNSSIPLSLDASHLRIVYDSHHPETLTYVFAILLLYTCISFHI